MALRLHVVMPSNRPQNIPILAPCYLQDMEPHPWEVRWHIYAQGPEPDYKGINKTNEAIELIRDGWVLLLADDTRQHPALFRRLAEIISANPGVGCVVFNQLRSGQGNVLHADPNHIVPAYICGGQVAWERGFLGEHRYKPEHGGWVDGEMIRELYTKDPKRFVFVPEVLMYFGSLEW